MTCLASDACVLDHPNPRMEVGHWPQGQAQGLSLGPGTEGSKEDGALLSPSCVGPDQDGQSRGRITFLFLPPWMARGHVSVPFPGPAVSSFGGCQHIRVTRASRYWSTQSK